MEDVKSEKNASTAKSPQEKDIIELKRHVGLYSGVALIVGTMIGSGIFVSPSGLIQRTGSIGMSLIVWALCGFVSFLGALAYAELGAMNPSSGAEYAYFMDAFGPFAAYMFSWTSALVLKPSQTAIICLSLAEYITSYICELSQKNQSIYAVKLVALIAILMVSYINCYSANLATCVQNIFTAGKLLAMLLVVMGGVYNMLKGHTENFHNIFEGTVTSPGIIATAFYSGLWAYDGWNNLNYATEEIENPSVNVPRAIFISIPLVTCCYLLSIVSYHTAMTPAEMIESEAVAITFGNQFLDYFSWIMPLSVAISTFGAANGTVFAAGRLCFAAGREGHLMRMLSYVDVKSLTPSPGLIFNGVIAILMILSGTIYTLIDLFSFVVWIFYGGAMIALLVMRRTKPQAPRPYKVPLVIPILILILSIYLVVSPIIDNPQVTYLYAIIFLIIGAVVYFPFVVRNYSPPFMEKVNTYVKLILNVDSTDLPIHEIEIEPSKYF